MQTSRRTSYGILGLVAVTALAGAALSSYAQQRKETAQQAVTAAAQALLKSLDDEQKKVAILPYDSPERVQWHFIPKDKRKGLSLEAMKGKPDQQKAAIALLRSLLSKDGADQAIWIIKLENTLKDLESDRRVKPAIRDPLRYYFTFFGDPAGTKPWGISIEGHHLSLNFVIEGPEIVCSTPLFFGANPAQDPKKLAAARVASPEKIAAREGDEKGGDENAGEKKPDEGERKSRRGGADGGEATAAVEHPLHKVEQMGFELLRSLKGAARTRAIFSDKAPNDLRAAGEMHPPLPTDNQSKHGVWQKDMDDNQRKLLRSLIGTYLDTLPREVAQRYKEDVENPAFLNRFFWAGAEKPGIGHYFRIEGEKFVLELCNTQPDSAGNPANHIHAVFRSAKAKPGTDEKGDFYLTRPAEEQPKPK